MFGISEESWIAIALFVAALVAGAVGTVVSGLLGCFTVLAKLFFDDASAKLAELPAIKTELTELRLLRQGDRKDIDKAHERLDDHEERIGTLEG